MKALIIAAGQGSRLNHVSNGRPKPLFPVLGVPLIERVIKTAKSAGIRDFYVVVGYKAEMIEQFLGSGEQWNVSITFVHNDEWEKGNGTSVLKAKDKMMEVLKDPRERFALLMADHIFDQRILTNIIDTQKEFSVLLAVERGKGKEGDTRVLEKDGRIVDIGKTISEYNCIDTGIFLCTSKIFDYVESAVNEGKNELANAIKKAADAGDAGVVDIASIDTYNSKLRKDVSIWWMDVDTPEDVKVAEDLIVENASKNPSDFIAAYVHKPIENFLVRRIAKYSITPNQVSTIVNILAYTTTALYALGYIIPGIIIALIVGIIDGIDGKLARVKLQMTKTGSLEHSFDMLYEFSWLISLAYYVSAKNNSLIYLLLGAISVTFIAFYRALYDQFRKNAGRSLDDSGPFERKFKRIAGRRNLYNIPILICAILAVPEYAVITIAVHAGITALVYAWRTIKHLKELDRID